MNGRRVIITGAARGIGSLLARRLHERGARVTLVGLEPDLLAEVAAGCGDAPWFECDVADRDQVDTAVAEAVERLGGLDVLVNNAGLALGRDPFDESTEEDEAIVIATNVAGLMRMTRLCLPHIRDGGHIVNMGSIAGRQAYPNGSSYVASKFAVRGYTYALREDLLGRPIRVTTVDAGLVETEFSLVRFGGDEAAAKSVYAGLEPVTPDDVAECVLFALTRPLHVNIDEIVVKALAQSSGARIVRAE